MQIMLTLTFAWSGPSCANIERGPALSKVLICGGFWPRSKNKFHFHVLHPVCKVPPVLCAGISMEHLDSQFAQCCTLTVYTARPWDVRIKCAWFLLSYCSQRKQNLTPTKHSLFFLPFTDSTFAGKLTVSVSCCFDYFRGPPTIMKML